MISFSLERQNERHSRELEMIPDPVLKEPLVFIADERRFIAEENKDRRLGFHLCDIVDLDFLT